MKYWQTYAVIAVLMAIPVGVSAQKAPLLPASQGTAIAQELSGALAHKNLEALAVYHRIRGSRQFHAAAQLVVDSLHAYGLADAHIEEFPADGTIYYGTLEDAAGLGCGFWGIVAAKSTKRHVGAGGTPGELGDAADHTRR